MHFTLKQWDTLDLDARIDALAQAYLDTLPKDAYDFAKEKIENRLTACGEALADLQETHRETPQPLFEFFTKLLAIGIHFFERVRYFLQSLIDK